MKYLAHVIVLTVNLGLIFYAMSCPLVITGGDLAVGRLKIEKYIRVRHRAPDPRPEVPKLRVEGFAIHKLRLKLYIEDTYRMPEPRPVVVDWWYIDPICVQRFELKTYLDGIYGPPDLFPHVIKRYKIGRLS